jgi:release factor glutamine methyltransferase
MSHPFLAHIRQLLQELYPGREGDTIFREMKEYLDQMDELALHDIVQRLERNEPWQYVVGHAWFYGLELKVNSSVLIPRMETEELVHLILSENGQEGLKVLDIGTGSGCIPLALKFYRAHWDMSACDVSDEALKIAEANATACGMHISFFQADILVQEPSGRYDIIVSNPPYIAQEEATIMPAHVLDYEPHLALFSGDDPQLFYRRLAIKGRSWLEERGLIYLELNEFHAESTRRIFLQNGYSEVEIIRDLAGKDRMLRAKY